MRVELLRIAALLAISLVAAGVYKAVEHPHLPWFRQPPPWGDREPPPDPTSIPRPELSLEEVRAALAEGSAVLLDARPEDDFAAGHIPGSLSLFALAPAEQPDHPLLTRLDRGLRVICTCKNAECTIAYTLAWQLEQLGFRDLAIFPAGVEGWQQAGLELATGAPASLEKP